MWPQILLIQWGKELGFKPQSGLRVWALSHFTIVVRWRRLFWESLGQQDQTSQSYRKSTLNIHCRWQPSYGIKQRGNSLLVQVKEESNKAGLKLNIQKKKIMAFGPLSSVTQSVQLVDPKDCSTPGFPVHHQLPEPAQIHVHWAGDAIQPSHPLSSPSPPAFNLSQHQGLFQWIISSRHVAKVLELQPQYQSFQWIFRTIQDFL